MEKNKDFPTYAEMVKTAKIKINDDMNDFDRGVRCGARVMYEAIYNIFKDKNCLLCLKR